MLDASKAFDRVNIVKLMNILIDRKVSPFALRILLHMLITQQSYVCWNSFLSDRLTHSNGTRQGSILSAILFIVYFDILIALYVSYN